MPLLLAEAMRAYRIGVPQGAYPIWSTAGAERVSGRWHEAGAEVIYASEHYSTALLEALAHWNGVLPVNQSFVEITIPRGTSYELVSNKRERGHPAPVEGKIPSLPRKLVSGDKVPNWLERSGEAARRFGREWFAENRSAILVVPSVVARMENKVVINARHPDFAGLKVGPETPVLWDERLFPKPYS